MKRFTQPRNAAELPEPLNRQLSQYVLAATAAGVGMLALAQSAEAKIVYTPADKKIPHGVTPLDLNHDKTNDFFFSHTGDSHHSVMYVFPATKEKSNRIWGGRYDASALKAGISVGSKGKFTSQYAHVMARWSSTSGSGKCEVGSSCDGPWVNVKNRYLGFKFYIKGKAHYGWARLNVSVGGFFDVKATLTGYAYETIANKPIITGKTEEPDVITLEPGGLGALAAGASRLHR